MPTFNKFCFVIALAACLSGVNGVLWAMDEDEYARIAAQNIILQHEARGDFQAFSEKSEEFLGQLSEEQKQDYLRMAGRIMKDKDLAQRISQRIVNFLIQMGYKVIIGSEGDIDSISIGEPSR